MIFQFFEHVFLGCLGALWGVLVGVCLGFFLGAFGGVLEPFLQDFGGFVGCEHNKEKAYQ